MHFFVIRGIFVEGEGFKATQKARTVRSLPQNLKTGSQPHLLVAKASNALAGKPAQKLLAQDVPDAGCSGGVRRVLARAHSIADTLKHAEVDCEHLMLAMALDHDGRATIEKFEFDPDRTRVAGVNAIASRDLHPEPVECKAARSQTLVAILAAATERAGRREAELRRCSIEDVLNAILTAPVALAARKLIEGYDASGQHNVVQDEVRALKSVVEGELRALALRVANANETSQTILDRINQAAARRSWNASPLLSAGGRRSGQAANDNGVPLRLTYTAVGIGLLLVGGIVGYLLHDGASVLQRFVVRVLALVV